MSSIKFLAVCADRPKSGKDTFVNLLKQKDSRIERIGFADPLKLQLYDFVMEYYGWDSFNLTPEQKDVIRPLWIAHGEGKRKQDKSYWIKLAHQKIENWHDQNTIFISSDTRYLNEYQYFKDIYGDSYVLVEIHKHDAPPPPKEEVENFPALKEKVDYLINWPNVGENLELLQPYIDNFYNKYLK